MSYDKSDLVNPLLIWGIGLDRVVSDDKSDFDKCSSIMSDEEIIRQSSKMILRSRKKSKGDLTGG